MKIFAYSFYGHPGTLSRPRELSGARFPRHYLHIVRSRVARRTARAWTPYFANCRSANYISSLRQAACLQYVNSPFYRQFFASPRFPSRGRTFLRATPPNRGLSVFTFLAFHFRLRRSYQWQLAAALAHILHISLLRTRFYRRYRHRHRGHAPVPQLLRRRIYLKLLKHFVIVVTSKVSQIVHCGP